MKTKNKKDKKAILSAVGVGCAFCIFSFLTFTIVSPIVPSQATTITTSAGPNAYKASISAESSVLIPITPTGEQEVFTGTNTITYTNACPYGFNIYLSSTTTDTNLTRFGEDNGQKIIPTMTSGTALADNTWGFSIDGGNTFKGLPVLDSPATIVDTNSANTSAATFDLVYGIKTDDSMPSGAYIGDVSYSVSVKPECINYTLEWDLDGGTAESGKTYANEAVYYGNSRNMSNYKPTKKGFTLTGWKSSVDGTVFDSSNTSYVNINPTNALRVKLTAQWRRNPLGEIDEMQELTPEICSAASVNDEGNLVDSRNGKSYKVRKLKDGHCWMVENLQLDNYTLTSADSDVREDFEVPATIETLSTEHFNGGYSIDPSDVYITGTYGYYSYYEATAGIGTYRYNEAEVSASVCPKGWRLPSKSNYQTLIDEYNDEGYYYDLNDAANFRIYAGIANDGEIHGKYSFSTFWTGTSYDGNAWAFQYNSGTSVVVGATSKVQGAQVRCIDEDRTLGDITHMQDINPGIVSRTESGATATLTDMRDNSTYTVKKLRDGRLWMTENLKLGYKQAWAAESDYPTPGGDRDAFLVPTSNLSSFGDGNTVTDTSAAYLDSTYGGYYNFYTATAGWGTSSVSSGTSPRSICPKGWGLPTPDEFQTLYDEYNSLAKMMADPGFVYSGEVENGAISGQGSYGKYWSVQTYKPLMANNLYINSGSNPVYPSSGNSKAKGFTIRCVARQ